MDQISPRGEAWWEGQGRPSLERRHPSPHLVVSRADGLPLPTLAHGSHRHSRWDAQRFSPRADLHLTSTTAQGMVYTGVLSLLFMANVAIRQSGDFARAREAVNGAIHAVETDSAAVSRGNSRNALARNPRDAVASLVLATLSRLTYDYADADRRFERLSADPALPAGTRAYAHLGLGLSHASRWHLSVAGPYLSQAAGETRAAGDRSGEAEATMALLRLVTRAGNPDSARVLMARVAAILPTTDPAVTATSYCLLAGASRQSSASRADSLLALGEQAAQRGHRRTRGTCLFLRAQILELRGFMTRSVVAASAAADSLRLAKDSEWLATAMQYWAYQALFSINFDVVRRAATEAMEAGARSGNVVAAGWAGLNLAQLALRLGDVAEASRRAQRARVTLDSLGDRFGTANALFVLGDAASLGGSAAQSQRSFEQADSLNVAIGATGSRPAVLYRLAALAREQKQPDRAAALLDSVVAIATRIGATGWLDVDVPYERGLQALGRGDWREALQHFERFRLNTTNASHYQYDVLQRMAQALVVGGQLDSARTVLAAALRSQEELDEALTDRDARVAVLSGRRFDQDPDLGLATTVAGFVAAERVVDAVQIADARRARRLQEQSLRRLSLVRDSARAQAIAARRMARQRLDPVALRRAMPGNTALLAYVTGRGGEPTTLFVLTRGGQWGHRLAPADSLTSLIGRLVSVLQSGGDGGSLSRALGAGLLDAALVHLGADITRLVVIPDGPLHRLPFDVLRLADGKRVLERFEVSLAPSLRMAQEWWNAPLPSRAGQVVAFGDPAFDPATGFRALPASRNEARLAAATAPGGTGRAYLGAAASEHALAGMDLTVVRLLHIASHAQVEDWGILNSALYLSPGGGDDGRMGAEEVAQLHLDTELVVLSGCRTLGGVVTVGEGLQGLVAPFLDAGARSVVATYWDMDDRALADVMRSFYASLRQGASAAAALRSAKLAALRAGEPATVWAGLALFGDGSVRPLAAPTLSR